MLSQVAGETGAAGDATRGTEISSVIVRPGNIPLTPDTLNTVGQVPTEIEVGGPERRHDRGDGRRRLVRAPRLDRAGRGRDDDRPDQPGLGGRPPSCPSQGEIPEDDDLTLIVTVYPGARARSIVDNNELTYQVRFGG